MDDTSTPQSSPAIGPNPRFSDLLRDFKLLLAFGFGSGLSPIVPGTMGTLSAVPFMLALLLLPLPAYLLCLLVASVFGVYLCGYASKRLGVHDHKGIVWDEYVGLWITFIAVPVSWQTLLAGFVLFRFFDMVKPWPISIADRKIHGGLGIMLDDILAGSAAWALMQLAMWYQLI
ncbi:phosphatidylglycerophosphatase A family protein [Teredinibacter waterburyi]|uniref:phosphatidylglycerophosphatase A family protein n=1 Tax=Teredinibacter waterburyi TaxID=1500538 RepID=UPI003CCBF882